MKLTIKGSKITNAKVTNYVGGDGVNSIEIEFDKDKLWNDIGFWLEDENGNITDYMSVNCSIRNKLQIGKKGI